MKRTALLAISLMTLVACSESFDGSSISGPQNTINVPGNTATCGTIDFSGCFARLDNEFKVLYERNNALSRRGESVYKDASNSNNELAVTFLATTSTQAQALAQLDKFISMVSASYAAGNYSSCAANQILARAQWLRNKVATANVDVSDPTPWDCEVSPVMPSAAGSVTAGVTLTINDPWDYNNDKYGVYDNQTYFTVERAIGANPFTPFLTTAYAPQSGPTTFTITDPASNQLGVTYTYRVIQCSYSWGYCSVPATASVTIGATPPTPECPHDNRNGNWVDNKNWPKCAPEDKIFKNK